MAWAVEKEIAALEEKKNSMTLAEKVAAIESSLFTLSMKDRWIPADFGANEGLDRQVESLTEILNKKSSGLGANRFVFINAQSCATFSTNFFGKTL